MFLGFVSSFIKNTHFLSYFLPIVGYFEFYFFRLILSPNNLDHTPWRGKGGVFHHSWVSPRTRRPMGIPQCHLLWGTRTTESAAGLSHCISPSPLVPRPLLPLCRSQQSLSPSQFCAVPVVTALCSLFPTLILPSVLLFFFVGVVKPCWFPRYDCLPLPDLWHHLSFKKTSRKFPWEPAHAERWLAIGRGETFKPSKALTSFRRELNVLPLQLLLALGTGDGQRGIHHCLVWGQKSSACVDWPAEHSPLLSKDQSNQGSQERCFFPLTLWVVPLR